jgi:hypothetical protein
MLSIPKKSIWQLRNMTPTKNDSYVSLINAIYRIIPDKLMRARVHFLNVDMIHT